MGEVYSVRDPLRDLDLALKVHAIESWDQATIRRFRREFRAAARVQHESIVRVYDEGTTAHHIYYSMELVEGTPLNVFFESPRDRAQRLSKSRIPELLEVYLQICESVSAIHAHRIIHRDLKPGNILVTSGGVPKLIDFGIAKLLTERTLTQAGEVMGTLTYSAPEQFLGPRVDARADVYSLGAMLYRLLVGRPPHEARSLRELLSAYAEAKITPVSQLVPWLPMGLDSLLDRMLSGVREKRPATATAVAEELSSILGRPTRSLAAAPLDPAVVCYEADLVGREEELTRIDAALDRLQRGEGGALLLSGPDGVGRTRMLTELRARAALREVPVLWGECRKGAGAPYEPFVQALDDFHRRNAEIWHLSPADLPYELYGLSLLSADSDDGGDPDPSASCGKVIAATARWLTALTESGPLVLALEDLHRAARSTLSLTWALLNRISAEGLPLLLAGTYTTAAGQEGGRTLKALEAWQGVERIVLEELTMEEVGRMWRSMTEATEITADRLEPLWERSRGIPREVVDLVRRGEVLEEEEDLLLDADITITGGGLSGSSTREAARAVARWGSVLGPDWDFDLLVAVSDLPEEVALDGVETNVRRAVLAEVDEDRYRFVHDRRRLRIRRGIPEGQRRQYHLRVAEILEAREGRDRWLEALFDQFRRSSSPERALPYGVKQARRLALQGSLRSAEQCLERCDEIQRSTGCDQTPSLDLFMARSAVQYQLGQPHESLESLRSAEELAETSQERAEILFRKAVCHYQLGKLEKAEAAARSCLKQAEALGRYRLQGRLLRLCGDIQLDRGNPSEAMELYDDALGLAETHMDQDGRFLSLHLLGEANYQTGRFPEAARSASQAEQVLDDRQDLWRESLLLGLLAGIEVAFGRYERGAELAERATEIARQLGLRRGEAVGLERLGLALLGQGKLDEALEVLREAASIFRRMDVPLREALVRTYLAEAAYLAGKLSEARPELEIAADLTREQQRSTAHVLARAYLAAVRVASGSPEQGLVELGKSLTRAKDLGLSALMVPVRLCQGDALWWSGDLDGAAEAYRKGLTALRDGGEKRHLDRLRAGLSACGGSGS